MSVCCYAPSLQWVQDPDTQENTLFCVTCQNVWGPSPAPVAVGGQFEDYVIQSLSRIENGLNNGSGSGPGDQYQKAWNNLVERRAEKTSWGKNALAKLMEECLLD